MSYRLISEKCKEQNLCDIAEQLVVLSASQSTLRYNEYDVSTEYQDRLYYEIDDYRDDYLEPFQGRLHNYLSASYSHHENLDRVVDMIGGDLKHRYGKYIHEVPPLLAVRGLRNFAQHNRPLPLEFSKNNKQKEVKLSVDVRELIQLDDGWDQSSLEYYFRPFVLEQGDPNKLNVMRAINTHYKICLGLISWLPGKVAKMYDIPIELDWQEVENPVYVSQTPDWPSTVVGAERSRSY